MALTPSGVKWFVGTVAMLYELMTPMREHELNVLLTILGSLGICVSAFCFWLVIRIINRRERWAKRVLTTTLVLPVLYVAGFGPAAWLASWELAPKGLVAWVYFPIFRIAFDGPERWFYKPVDWYAHLGEFHEEPEILRKLYWKTWPLEREDREFWDQLRAIREEENRKQAEATEAVMSELLRAMRERAMQETDGELEE
jgi:hypothetical protein